MHRRLASTIALAGVLLLGVVGTSGAAASGSLVSARLLPNGGGVMKKAVANEVLPLHGGAVQSANWSGYVVSAGNITGVSTTFVVPAAGLIPPGGFAATWTGIGGFKTSDLIQAGVGEGSLPTLPVLGPQYFAWYELLPGAEIPLTNCVNRTTNAATACTVTPGDAIAVNITLGLVTAGKWTISMIDATKNWSSTTTTAYSSTMSSAEWVLEAPQLLGVQTLVANVGNVTFGNSTYNVGGGAPQPISNGTPTQLDMSAPLGLGLIPEATPSGLAPSGESFASCSYTTSCATP
jgi:hypothetical protein